MKITAFAATLATLFTVNVQADMVGLYLGGQILQSEVSGVFGEKNTPINFNLKKEQQVNYFIAIEHPFPLLPNLRISNASFDTTGKTNLTQKSNFDNETSHVSVDLDADVDASFDVSYVDYTLYYELFDKALFSFDIGLTVRALNVDYSIMESKNTITTTRDFIWDGEEHDEHDYHSVIEITNTVDTRKIKNDEVMPMLYIATNAALPLTGLSAFAQGDFLLKDDHTLYDYQIGLSYDLVDNRMIDLNLTLGYKVEKMKFEDLDNLYTDIDFKGAFVGIMAHF